MSGSLGIHAFRSSVRIFAHHSPKPSNRLPVFTSQSRRYISSLLQHQPFQCNNKTTPSNSSPLSRKCRPVYQSRPTGLRTLKIRNPIIVHYVNLPADYTDEVGLPFLGRELDAGEVIAMFGPKMTTSGANKLLRILHGRRVAGTLEDPEVQVNTLGYSKKDQKIALDYLRKNIPVDEIVNAGLRAEDELPFLEGREVEESETAPKKPTFVPAPYKTLEKSTEEPGRQEKPSVYGEGVFDAIRARNKARMEEEIRRQEEEKRKQEEELAKLTPGELAKIEQKQTRQLSPKMQEWVKTATSDLEAPPEMKTWERILPSAVVVLLATGLLVAYSEYYRPPKRKDRLWPDIPPAAAAVIGLLGLNLIGFAIWKVPPLWSMLNKYFLIVPATPKPASLFLAMFSHHTLFHLVPNMVALCLFGAAFHDEVGRGTFLATYLGTGMLSAVVSMSVYAIRQQFYVSMCGASGAIYGIAGGYFWLNRFEEFRLFGLPPEPISGIPGLAFLGLGIGLNIIGLSRLAVHNIDVIAHLSGAVFGVLAAHFIEKKREAKKQLLAEQKKKPRAEGLIPAPTSGPADQSIVKKVVEETKA